MLSIPKYFLGYLFLLFPVFFYAEELTLSGLIQSDNQKQISSKYSGFVEKVYVQEGNRVKKGDNLLKIDSKELQTSKAQLLLSISQARLNYNTLKYEYLKTEKDYKRYKELIKKEMISKSSFEEVELKEQRLKNSLEISKKEINQLQEQLQKINKEFTYLNIKASSNALVIEKNINEGELTSISKPLLTLCDIEDLVVYLDVGESHLRRFVASKEVAVFIESLDLLIKGKIEAILPNVDPSSGNFRVKIALEKSEQLILPGMYAQVSIK